MNKHKTYSSLADSLHLLVEKSHGKSLTIAEIMKILSGKGSLILLILLSLPFCQPISLPGLSTPFGIVIIIIGLRIAINGHSFLPKFVAKRKVSPKKLKIFAEKSLKILKFLNKFIKSRKQWICIHPFLRRAHGIYIAFLGFLLALPLPIPASNIVVAWPLVFMGLALLEEDGLCVAVSYGIFTLLLLIFFAAIYFLEVSFHLV